MVIGPGKFAVVDGDHTAVKPLIEIGLRVARWACVAAAEGDQKSGTAQMGGGNVEMLFEFVRRPACEACCVIGSGIPVRQTPVPEKHPRPCTNPGVNALSGRNNCSTSVVCKESAGSAMNHSHNDRFATEV